MTERLTPDTIAAERDILDGEERLVLGGVVVTLGFTNAAVKALAPRETEELAAYLLALLELAPVKSSPAFAPHRIVLGALATELRGFAAAAGEPIGLEADLRAATSQAEERRIRERLADHAAAFTRHIDDVLLSNAAQGSHHDPHLPGVVISDTDLAERGIDEEEAPPETATPAPAPTEADDVSAWL